MPTAPLSDTPAQPGLAEGPRARVAAALHRRRTMHKLGWRHTRNWSGIRSKRVSVRFISTCPHPSMIFPSLPMIHDPSRVDKSQLSWKTSVFQSPNKKYKTMQIRNWLRRPPFKSFLFYKSPKNESIFLDLHDESCTQSDHGISCGKHNDWTCVYDF